MIFLLIPIEFFKGITSFLRALEAVEGSTDSDDSESSESLGKATFLQPRGLLLSRPNTVVKCFSKSKPWSKKKKIEEYPSFLLELIPSPPPSSNTATVAASLLPSPLVFPSLCVEGRGFAFISYLQCDGGRKQLHDIKQNLNICSFYKS
jgi:hypothetical protein